MFALLNQASNQLETRYEKEALAVSGIGHPPSHYNTAGDLEDRCRASADATEISLRQP